MLTRVKIFASSNAGAATVFQDAPTVSVDIQSAAIRSLKTYDSVSAVQSAQISTAVNFIRTAGYAAAGDGGGALYKRSATEPAHNGKIQSDDGAWWELSENNPIPQMFGAKGDGTTDDIAAFNSAIGYAAGGVVRIPFTEDGYLLSDTLSFAGQGQAKSLLGDRYVTLFFDSLATTKDGVVMKNVREDGGIGLIAGAIKGVTIDLGNTDASNASYTKGRDGLKLEGGEWPDIDVIIQNVGRDGFHYESPAAFGWLENLRANLRIFNCGRDAIHLNCANFTSIFANELNFENVEARRWKRHAVHCVVNTLSATYSAAKMSNVRFPKTNFDANRNVADLTATDVIYFEKVTGAPSNGLFDAFEFGNGGWENVIESMSGYGINADSGATVRNLRVMGPVIMYNIIAPVADPFFRIANYAVLTKPFLVFDTVDPGRVLISHSTNIAHNFALSAFISPTQITSDQNDYNPSSLHQVFSVRLTSDAARSLTGLNAGYEDGEIKAIRNANTTAGRSITLKHESTSSSAANRFALGGADCVIPIGQTAILRYASSSSRWELISLSMIVDNDGTFAANSDDRLVTQKSAKTYADTKVSSITSLSTLTTLNGGQLAGFRNLLINADGRINQRLLGAAALTDNIYGHDRWVGLTQTAGITPSTLDDAENGTSKMWRLSQANSTAQRMGYCQWVESLNCKFLRGKSVTLSGRVRLSTTATVRYAICEWTGTADTPGAARDIVNDWTSSTYTAGNFFKSTTFNVLQVGSLALTANTLTDLTAISATVGNSANNLVAFIWTEATAAQNVTLDGALQLEQGTVATAREFRPITTEYAQCLRYYQKSFLLNTAPVQNVGNGFGELLFIAYSAGRRRISALLFSLMEP